MGLLNATANFIVFSLLFLSLSSPLVANAIFILNSALESSRGVRGKKNFTIFLNEELKFVFNSNRPSLIMSSNAVCHLQTG